MRRYKNVFFYIKIIYINITKDIVIRYHYRYVGYYACDIKISLHWVLHNMTVGAVQ